MKEVYKNYPLAKRGLSKHKMHYYVLILILASFSTSDFSQSFGLLVFNFTAMFLFASFYDKVLKIANRSIVYIYTAK